MFWLFGREACGLSAPGEGVLTTDPQGKSHISGFLFFFSLIFGYTPRREPMTLALEGEVLTIGPPGKSPSFLKHFLLLFIFGHTTWHGES